MGRDAQYLADMKIEGLTTDWTPCTGKFLVKTTSSSHIFMKCYFCTVCMKDDRLTPEAVRCLCDPEEGGLYTVPSVTRSKIGECS